jgi:hypothetical protein
MNWATLLSPMTSPEADTVSGGKTAVDVVVEEGTETVVEADSVVAVEGTAADGRFEVGGAGSRLSLEVRGGGPVAQAARASPATSRQTVATAVQREDR